MMMLMNGLSLVRRFGSAAWRNTTVIEKGRRA